MRFVVDPMLFVQPLRVEAGEGTDGIEVGLGGRIEVPLLLLLQTVSPVVLAMEDLVEFIVATEEVPWE